MNDTTKEDAVIELLTLTCEIDQFGTKRYFNKDGKLHRIHGPAKINVTGTTYWYKNSMKHREDGPAIIWFDGTKEYFINDIQLTEEQFIQRQFVHVIKPIE